MINLSDRSCTDHDSCLERGQRLLRSCSDEDLAQELREPTTAYVALRELALREALARIIERKATQ